MDLRDIKVLELCHGDIVFVAEMFLNSISASKGPVFIAIEGKSTGNFRLNHETSIPRRPVNEKHLSSELERCFLWICGSRGSRTPDPLLVRQML